MADMTEITVGTRVRIKEEFRDKFEPGAYEGTVRRVGPPEGAPDSIVADQFWTMYPLEVEFDGLDYSSFLYFPIGVQNYDRMALGEVEVIE